MCALTERIWNLNRLSPLEADLTPLPPLSGATPPRARTSGPSPWLCLEDMKAEETVEIDLTGKTSLADTMIVTSGRSHRHVGAIAERVIEALKDGASARRASKACPPATGC